MEFRIADTFTESLARLTGDEQKAVGLTAFQLQLNPANPGMSFHKLDKVKDKNFWSVRVNDDIRLIVHRIAQSLMLCYVDHHDKAYEWAGRRKLETHPKTGAAQLVEIRETVREIIVPLYVDEAAASRGRKAKAGQGTAPALLFAGRSDDELLGYGVPAEWLADVKAATSVTLEALADHLPAEAAEALLEIATGGTPRIAPPPAAAASAFDHPDALRRFRVMGSVEELRRALDFPWDKWTVFLHPDQKDLVERHYAGPARVSGSAGTGKTIVALHRAVHLARTHEDARVLLTTFSDPLASALAVKLRRLVSSEPRLAERIDVHSLNAVALRLHKAHAGPAKIADRETVRGLIREAASAVSGHRFSQQFLVTEWDQVVDAWQLAAWDDYRDAPRLGRKTRLPEAQRKTLWSIFERVRAGLDAAGQITWSGLFTAVAAALANSRRVVFDFVVVDEAQDLGVAHVRFLAALGGASGGSRPDALFFAGDLGQRIFQQPFSWKALGVDVRGRSRTLRVNYRTSHQIRTHADRLLGPAVTDVDGNREERGDTVSVFNGPLPLVRALKTEAEEIEAVGGWIAEQAKAGVAPHEFGVFVRSEAQLQRAQAAVAAAGLAFKVLDEHVETPGGHVAIGTMHLAKGLEFRAVAVMACDDEVIPLQERIESIGDDADLQEVYDTERHLLYVACTRARDHLLVTGVSPVSEFLDDFAA
jgi:mRNA-degrading endonuclease RelE of RelBE toxin-antitoxin system